MYRRSEEEAAAGGLLLYLLQTRASCQTRLRLDGGSACHCAHALEVPGVKTLPVHQTTVHDRDAP